MSPKNPNTTHGNQDWANVADQWPERIQAAAGWILDDDRVLDLGAGAQGLRPFVGPGLYTPVDHEAVGPDTIVLDLNNDFPKGEWDVVVGLGILEHVRDPYQLVCRSLEVARSLVIFTFATLPHPHIYPANDYTADDIHAELVDLADYYSVATFTIPRPLSTLFVVRP